jgi:hypothetical protein
MADARGLLMMLAAAHQAISPSLTREVKAFQGCLRKFTGNLPK